MHRTRLSTGVLTGLLALGGALVAASPASADYSSAYELTTRPDGLPATDDPARRLVAGTLGVGADRDGLEAWASIELAGEPNQADDALLVLSFGSLDYETGACTVTWERTISTFAPETSPADPVDLASSATRVGTVVEARWELTAEQHALIDQGCAAARVVDPVDGTTYDGLDGEYSGGVISDPIYVAKITGVSGRHVRPGRWSTLRLEVRSRSDVRGFSVTGRQRGVTVRTRESDRVLPPGSTTTVRVQVRLEREKPIELSLFLHTYGSAFGPVDVRRVRLVPQRR